MGHGFMSVALFVLKTKPPKGNPKAGSSKL